MVLLLMVEDEVRRVWTMLLLIGVTEVWMLLIVAVERRMLDSA